MPITLSAAAGNTVFNTQGNTLTLGTPLSGPGGLQKIGGGTLVLSASNNYAGTTLVSAGTLDVTGTLGGGTVQVNAGADVGVLGRLTARCRSTAACSRQLPGDRPGALAGTGTATNDGPGSLTTLTVGGLGTNSSFSGTILDGSGLTALTKIGPGTLVLSGTDSYQQHYYGSQGKVSTLTSCQTAAR